MLLHSASGRPLGRVSLLVADESGGRFALTARHVAEAFACDADPAVDGQLLALPLADNPLPHDSDRPLWEAVGRIAVLAGDPLFNGPLLTTTELAIDAAAGDAVNRLTADGALEPGVITAVGGLVEIGGSTVDQVHTFSETIEVCFNGDADRLDAGAGGGLVLDRDGRPLGVIITGRRAACYVAPIEPYLRSRGLDPCALSTTARPTWSFESLTANLEAFQAAMRQSQGLYLTVDENPPQSLLDRPREIAHVG